MYDCETVRGPFRETKFECSQDNTKIEISISPSDGVYVLSVHYDKVPVFVAVDSRPLHKYADKAAYDAAYAGWYYGPGYFYGSDTINTVNVKIPKRPTARLIRIAK